MATIIDFKNAPKKKYGGYPNEISQSINEKLKKGNFEKEWEQQKNYHDSTSFDTRQIYTKLIIPDYVPQKDITSVGTYNGKNKRRGTEYFDGFYWNRKDQKIYQVDTPWSKLDQTDSSRGYIGRSIGNLLWYWFHVYNSHIDNAVFDRNYDKVNAFIEIKNTIIYEALSYGVRRDKIIELLEGSSRKNSEFNDF